MHLLPFRRAPERIPMVAGPLMTPEDATSNSQTSWKHCANIRNHTTTCLSREGSFGHRSQLHFSAPCAWQLDGRSCFGSVSYSCALLGLACIWLWSCRTSDFLLSNNNALTHRWHQAGCGLRKEQSILDLIACLDHLITSGELRPLLLPYCITVL